ncbi:MAG: tetratricopeptide repeat protein [Bacteroidota bacterium]
MNDKFVHGNKWLHFTILLVAILIAYLKIFHAGFMSWDDGEYVLHNKDITGFGYIGDWFSKFYLGNYHPLTMLSYAVDFAIGGTHPLIYHIINLLLHVGTAWALYLFIKRLSGEGVVALFVALLFAVHPVQTESVSWIAERKTVLSGVFYVLALWQYTRYVATPSVTRLAVVTLLGIAAMLSKGTAVTLPLALLATDIWLGRNIADKNAWLPKLPLFALSVLFGIVAIKAQGSAKFLNLHPEYGLFDSVVYAGYAYVQYIINLLAPFRLSVIYPYPPAIGAVQYLYLVLAIAILALGIIAYRKRWYVLSGSIAFYTVNIIFVLQFIQFGESLMADRYMYIACIGILYPLVSYLYKWLAQRSKKAVATGISAGLATLLLVQTFVRNDIWLSDLNFFTAILDTFPNSSVAHYSVGALYMKDGDYAAAERHLNAAVSIDPQNYKAWHSRGALYLRQGKAMEALDALNKSIELNEYIKAYFSRAMLYEGTGKPDLAIADIDKVLAAQPQNARAWYIKGDCLEQKSDMASAVEHYSRAIEFENTEPLFYIRRGLLLSKQNKNAPALDDLERAVALDPRSGEAVYYRGIIKYRNRQEPCADLRSALKLGYTQAREALDKLCKGAQ